MAPKGSTALWACCFAAVTAAGLRQSAAAQDRTAVPIKVQGVRTLDSTRQRFHDTLWKLRDTVGAVRLAVEQFQRDPSSVSRETVLSRATTLQERCRAAIRLLSAAEPVFAPEKVPARPPQARSGAVVLVREMRALRAQLDASCLRGFATAGPGVRADSVRAWAGYMGAQIQQALTAYERAVSEFVVKADFRLEPSIPKN